MLSREEAAARGGPQHGPVPGIALCLGIALVARLLQALEERAVGHSYLDGLVLAILLGVAVRTAWEPDERWRPGIRLSAGRLLERVPLSSIQFGIPRAGRA